MNKWMQFFRLPNLPTAPGDALVGAAFLLPFVPNRLAEAFIAAGAALLLYMFGLADNDVVGAPTDGPERPIPAGRLSLHVAQTARTLLLLAAGGLALAGGLPLLWHAAALALVIAILAYNRTKKLFLMGLCRGLSVVCGGCAMGHLTPPGMGALAFLSVGWTAYIAAVTKLSEGEERPSDGLGWIRYAWGTAAFLPVSACFFLPDVHQALLPAVGSLFTFLAWCAATAPLNQPHGPCERRRAVGRTIRALLYLQIGYMLVSSEPAFLAAAAGIWIASRLIRQLAPTISGS